jgi:heptosyltransferase-2
MHHDDTPPRPMVPFYAALADAPGAALPGGLPKPRMAVGAAQMAAACAKVGLDPARALVVFAPGAEFGGAKRWPPAHFGQLARHILARDPQAQVALLGSPKDSDSCNEVIAAAGTPAGLVSLAGKTSLSDAVALIAQSAAVVSNDSGLLHVASALNRPVIAIYGPTDPDHAPPFSDLAASISLRLDCSPCRQRECPLGHQNCMHGISAGQVWQTLQPMLSR